MSSAQPAEKPVFIHPTAVVDQPCVVGAGTKIWHFSHLMPHCSLGNDCIIGQNVFIAGGVSLGNGVKVQNNVSLYSGVMCEDGVFLGPCCVFTNVLNPRAFIERKTEFKATLIKKGASIGANATLVCGITVGRYALVGAGALLSRDVPDFALVYGNPARQMGWVSKNGHKLSLDGKNMAICPETGELYQLENGQLICVADGR